MTSSVYDQGLQKPRRCLFAWAVSSAILAGTYICVSELNKLNVMMIEDAPQKTKLTADQSNREDTHDTHGMHRFHLLWFDCMSIQPKTETNNALRVWEVEGVQTSYQRDPAVRVRLSMMPALEVLLGCCVGGRPWAPLADGKETRSSGTLKRRLGPLVVSAQLKH